jgi:hypothetical protein
MRLSLSSLPQRAVSSKPRIFPEELFMAKEAWAGGRRASYA